MLVLLYSGSESFSREAVWARRMQMLWGLVAQRGYLEKPMLHKRPPLCYRGQSSWLQVQNSQVRFPVLPDSLRSSGSGM
jgi:hypothetical protein